MKDRIIFVGKKNREMLQYVKVVLWEGYNVEN